MSVKLLTEHPLEFLSLDENAQARLSLHMSKCHIAAKSHDLAHLSSSGHFVQLSRIVCAASVENIMRNNCQSELPRTFPRNSVDSDRGSTLITRVIT